MKTSIYIFLIHLSICGPLPFTMTQNQHDLIKFENLTGQEYCDLLQELYVQSEWYLRLITKIDRESDIWIVKIFHDIGNFFYDTTSDDLKKYQIQFEKMTDIFFSYIEKQFGILNPVNENDWHEIVLILIA